MVVKTTRLIHKSFQIIKCHLQSYLIPPLRVPEEPSSVPEHDSEKGENVFDDFEGEDEMDDTEIVEDDELSSDG